MHKKKCNNAVVFGLTSNHIFGVACVMMDLKRLSPGKIDEVVIFRRALGAREVARIYREGNPYPAAESIPKNTPSERQPDRMAAGKANR